MNYFHPAWAWSGERWLSAPLIEWDEQGILTRITEDSPGATEPGCLLPGLVNAHSHLEIGPLLTAPLLGLPSWVRQLRAAGRFDAAGAGVEAAIRAGTAFVIDVSGSGNTEAAGKAAALPGHYFTEILGISESILPVGKLAPHAPYSTHPAKIQQLARQGVSSIHLDEDPAERQFLKDGSGPWAEYLKELGRDLNAFKPPGCSPVEYLKSLGVLGPKLLVVHATLSRGADLDLLAESGCMVALCLRSNLHISGNSPDVPGMIARKIPILLGTDSLASVPSLDLLQEAAILKARYPKIPEKTWLYALTQGAESLSGRKHRLELSAGPGLLWVKSSREELFSGAAHRRRWLACPTLS